MTKLHINMAQGVIDVEGEAELVLEIYRDFKERLLAGGFSYPAPADEKDETGGNADENAKLRTKSKRRASPRKRAAGDEGTSGVSPDAPKLDKNLDTSQLGTFYGQFEPKNNAERILIFLKFITEKLESENPNTDQVYTCFKKTGDKIPKAFAQAFYDTSTKHGYIDYRSATDIAITIAGDNHFNHGLKTKGGE